MAFSIFQQVMKSKPSGGLLPTGDAIVKAGAFGAILGVAVGGVASYARLRSGEISQDEAIKETLSSGARNAATMAVASVASHVVRTNPVIGFAALGAVGVGVLAVANQKRQEALAAEEEIAAVGEANVVADVEAEG